MQRWLGQWLQAGGEKGAPELWGYAETQGTCYSETRPGCKALDSLFSALCLIYQTTELLSLFCKSLSLPCCPEPSSVQQTCCWLCVTSKKKHSCAPREADSCRKPSSALLCRTALYHPHLLPLLWTLLGGQKDSSLLLDSKYGVGRDALDKQCLAVVNFFIWPLPATE